MTTSSARRSRWWAEDEAGALTLLRVFCALSVVLREGLFQLPDLEP
jgi:hypothetical protein